MVVGLYLVVWGKSKEHKGEVPESPTKENSVHDQLQLPVIAPRNDSNIKAQLVIQGDEQSDEEATIPKTESQRK